MSTEIGNLYSTMKEQKNELQVTRFYGGEKNGVCVQLTNQDRHYIQLNISDLMTLIPLLEEYIIEYTHDETILPNFCFEFSEEFKPQSTGIFKKMCNKFLPWRKK